MEKIIIAYCNASYSKLLSINIRTIPNTKPLSSKKSSLKTYQVHLILDWIKVSQSNCASPISLVNDQRNALNPFDLGIDKRTYPGNKHSQDFIVRGPEHVNNRRAVIQLYQAQSSNCDMYDPLCGEGLNYRSGMSLLVKMSKKLMNIKPKFNRKTVISENRIKQNAIDFFPFTSDIKNHGAKEFDFEDHSFHILKGRVDTNKTYHYSCFGSQSIQSFVCLNQ
ncbi:hypothetical protein WN51_08991 [Melipona quadrifasciata]|uniref:Uncharacterized protein n=1 Tax=Melipona quadrifasciata TaxID=166423 RepID=A0A0M9A9P9_9HYME|nr:hypothetical protein WN51_08991 [Melipona quadrifasciata]